MSLSVASTETARNAALVATLACVWLTAHYAQKIKGTHPRAFTALSLVALNWAVLLLYYLPGAPEGELLSSVSGFALINAGGLLYRQAVEDSPGSDPPRITWLDTLPLFLFRSSVLGLGLYYLAERLFHKQFGWGTLALALWGTFFAVLGYLVIWLGVAYLYRGRVASMRAMGWFGLVVGLYSAAEVTYAGWYVRDYWPAYSRYLAIRDRPGSPDFQKMLPFEPQPDWPEAHAWQRVDSTTERGIPAREIIGLRVQPIVPEPWVWLTYSLGALKLIFTIGLLWLVLCLPKPVAAGSAPLYDLLDRRLRLGAAGP